MQTLTFSIARESSDSHEMSSLTFPFIQKPKKFSAACAISTLRVDDILTLKAPRKTASENVVYLCRLLNILADFLKKYFCIQANSVDPDQTAPKGAV